MYDQRGLGESTGEKVTMGWEDGSDLLAAADWLVARPEVDAARLGIVGLSLGAQIGLNAAYEDQAAFSALWLDGTPVQTEVDLPLAENTGERFATFMNGILFGMAELHLGRPAPPPFKKILPALTLPRIVMIAAGGDPIERRVNAGYVLLMGPNIEYWLIENASHVGGPGLIPEEYTARMLGFFDRVLGP
jgi:pimeloyl-ACP methyl ester carboxylesterase